MKLFIKYMVSSRCKMAVKEALKKSGLHYIVVDLGEVDIMENLDSAELLALKQELSVYGLELMDDKNGLLIDQIKKIILHQINHTAPVDKKPFSTLLSEQLMHPYSFLAHLFSAVQGITIEQYTILHKIERIKELLIYSSMNTADIAWDMQYSSVAHLAGQFKKATGFTPVQYKLLMRKNIQGQTIENTTSL